VTVPAVGVTVPAVGRPCRASCGSCGNACLIRVSAPPSPRRASYHRPRAVDRPTSHLTD